MNLLNRYFPYNGINRVFPSRIGRKIGLTSLVYMSLQAPLNFVIESNTIKSYVALATLTAIFGLMFSVQRKGPNGEKSIFAINIPLISRSKN